MRISASYPKVYQGKKNIGSSYLKLIIPMLTIVLKLGTEFHRYMNLNIDDDAFQNKKKAIEVKATAYLMLLTLVSAIMLNASNKK